MRPEVLLTLGRRISAERFAPYRAAAGDDLERAITLYEGKHCDLRGLLGGA